MLDANGHERSFVGDGIVMSDTLADRLHVREGDLVDVEITEGSRPRIRRPVTALIRDYGGRTTYMARDALARVMTDGDVASGAALLVADDRRADFYRAVQRTPAVAAVGSRADTIAQWRERVAGTVSVEMMFFMGFASAIALGVAYNMSRVALAERARDLATLRVLGFAPRDCAYILLGEVLVLALAAAPLGILGGIGLADALVIAFSHQDLKLPLVITGHGYGLCLLTYLAVLGVAAVPVARRVWTLDLVRVLKTRE
jgi:putative ABC transport system permease protein